MGGSSWVLSAVRGFPPRTYDKVLEPTQLNRATRLCWGFWGQKGKARFLGHLVPDVPHLGKTQFIGTSKSVEAGWLPWP